MVSEKYWPMNLDTTFTCETCTGYTSNRHSAKSINESIQNDVLHYGDAIFS